MPKDAKIHELLLKIGVSPSSIAFNYITYSIKLILSDSTYLHNITKLLYVDVAKEFKTTSASIEKCMRQAIIKAWSKNGKEFREKLFLNCLDKDKDIPTNSQFLARLSLFLAK